MRLRSGSPTTAGWCTAIATRTPSTASLVTRARSCSVRSGWRKRSRWPIRLIERAVFERAAAFANDLGLLAEEVNAGTGELLGNFPQAFSHIGLVNAAWQISEAERRARSCCPIVLAQLV